MNLIPGYTVNGWSLTKLIGGGSHGDVWAATSQDGSYAAIKFLKPKSCTGNLYERFCSEIEVQIDASDIPNVLPVLDYHLPSNPSGGNRPWLAMPLAVSMGDALSVDSDLTTIVELVRDVVRVLKQLHKRGIVHRDIKPANIFRYNDAWTIGDFGLVSWPEKKAITAPGRKLGPLFYIAPEMLNSPTTADGKPADIYSIAKVLWKLSSGSQYPLPGEHRCTVPAMTISYYSDNNRAFLLDGILDRCTRFDPESRITASQLLYELERWLTPRAITMDEYELPDFRDLTQALEDQNTAQSQERHDLANDIQRLGDAVRTSFDTLNNQVSNTTGLNCQQQSGGINPLSRHPKFNRSDFKNQVSRRGAGFVMRVKGDHSQARVHAEFCASQFEETIFASFKSVLATGPLQQPQVITEIQEQHWTFSIGSVEYESVLGEIEHIARETIGQGLPKLHEVITQNIGLG